MKKILGLSILALACAPAFAQNATLTARESNSGKTVIADGGANSATVCFYGGDFDTRNGLSSERGTAVSDSWTFDDVTWAGGTVSTGWFNYLDRTMGTPTGADVIFYSGMAEGSFGTLVGQAMSAPVTTAPTGNSGFGLPEIKASWTLGGQAFNVPAGTYHVGMRAVGTGVGQCFISTASGTNGVGTPLSNGNVFFQSGYFGYPVPTDAQNVFGAGNWDMSRGIDCAGQSGYTLTLTGTCPGQVRIAWAGAPANTQQGIVFGLNQGNTTIPSGPCQGTVLGVAGQVQLYNTIGTGNGSGAVNGNAGSGACHHYLQLVAVGNPCKKSNVAQIP